MKYSKRSLLKLFSVALIVSLVIVYGFKTDKKAVPDQQTEITLKLSGDAVNYILVVLQERPFKESVGVINAIVAQLPKPVQPEAVKPAEKAEPAKK